jgi:hypothetical protein
MISLLARCQVFLWGRVTSKLHWESSLGYSLFSDTEALRLRGKNPPGRTPAGPENEGLRLDVPGVDAGLSCEGVVDLVRENRQSKERLLKGKSPPKYRFQPNRKSRERLNRRR